MTAWQIAMQSTNSAASAAGGELNLTSNGVFGSVVGPTIYKPLASSQMQANGQARKAGGSTAAILVYTNIPGEWWTDVPNVDGSLYEVYFDTLTNVPAGSSGVTWFGAARDTWLPLTSDRGWTLQKDAASFGSITWQVLIEIREIANPANTTGPQVWFHTVTYDL